MTCRFAVKGMRSSTGQLLRVVIFMILLRTNACEVYLQDPRPIRLADNGCGWNWLARCRWAMTEGSHAVDIGLWGKSRGLTTTYPLICHLLDTAAVAGELWDRYLSPATRRYLAAGMRLGDIAARKQVMFWAGLHDVGKAIPCFQAQDADAYAGLAGYPDARGAWVRHDEAIHLWLGQALAREGYAGDRASHLIAQLLGGHHGKFASHGGAARRAPVEAVPELGNGRWDEQRVALVAAVHAVLGSPEPVYRVTRDAAALSCGVVMLADWLVSQTNFVAERLSDLPNAGDLGNLAAHFARSVDLAPEVLADAGLGLPLLSRGSFKAEFPDIDSPNDLQHSIAHHLPEVMSSGAGLLVITAPPGVGKTETALHGARLMGEASGAPGLFFALPTMATADEMYVRVRAYVARRTVGPTALTRLHSMSWLSGIDPTVHEGDVVLTSSEQAQRASDWLHGSKRGVLASFAVGTVDQPMLAALPLRHNMLRMAGLAGKVVIIDEAHSYDAYMQRVLCVLLNWLARMGVPVVLLSATLPSPIARRLANAYLEGAGRKALTSFDLGYPGWAYVNATTGTVASRDVGSPKQQLEVDQRPVPIDASGHPERGGELRSLLEPVVEEGCAAVIVNTVADAQRVYSELRGWFDEIVARNERPPDLDLLHSRFPAFRREEITRRVIDRYGKAGTRTTAGVVVATQVIEQSLDLDFDLVVSDLAPVAMLLQRAGRCWRHERKRPGWSSGARLVVLSPTHSSGEPTVPESWRRVYEGALLRRTRELLESLSGQAITVPDDVQEMVEQVYDEEFAEGGMAADDMERLAADLARAGLAQGAAIPAPADIRDLAYLTTAEIDERLVSTRFGADSVRVLCCYRDTDGAYWLDPSCTSPLPTKGGGHNGRFDKDEIAAIMTLTVPVPAGWLTRLRPEHEPPHAWSDAPYLCNLTLVPHPVAADGNVGQADLGGAAVRLDHDEGLVRARS